MLVEMRKQTGWLRLLGIQTLRPLLERMTDAAERHAYELSDGRITSREVAHFVGRGKSTIARWWAEWIALGIATDAGDGRARHLVSLAELGIRSPKTASVSMRGETREQPANGEDSNGHDE